MQAKQQQNQFKEIKQYLNKSKLASAAKMPGKEKQIQNKTQEYQNLRVTVEEDICVFAPVNRSMFYIIQFPFAENKTHESLATC